MQKKVYQKPELMRVALSSEERLAACDFFYKTGYTGVGCRTSFYPDDNPGSCTILITPESIS